jgi:hypothetical protein
MQCTAVGNGEAVDGGELGQEATFDPNSPGSPTPTTIAAGRGLGDVACPSVTQCTALLEEAGAVTFNPLAPGTPSIVAIDDGYPFASIACPSTTQCTAVGPFSTSSPPPTEEVTFNPAAPGSPTAVTIDTARGSFLTSVACPSVTQCTAVGFGNDGGQEVTFNPTSPGSPTPVTIDSDGGPMAVACPSVTQCTAAENHAVTGVEVTFNPTSPGTTTQATLEANGTPDGIVCPSTTQCTTFSLPGLQATFNPTAPGSPTATPIGPLGFAADDTFGGACPSPDQCTAVGRGVELTFNPVLSVSPSPALASSPLVDGDVASVELRCGGLVGQTCAGAIAARTVEEITAHGSTVVGVSAKRPPHGRSRAVLVGQTRFTTPEGQPETVKLTLNTAGRKLLRQFKRMRAQLTITTTSASGSRLTVADQIVTFTTANRKVVGSA